MAYREFSDAEGREWRVWDTYPEKPQLVRPLYERGWLSFEGDGEKRRLAPIPAGWEAADRSALLGLLAKATGMAAAPAAAAG
jgi:hypothetical protein